MFVFFEYYKFSTRFFVIIAHVKDFSAENLKVEFLTNTQMVSSQN